MRAISLILVLPSLLVSTSRADDVASGPSVEVIDGLIDRLGSESFEDRELAARELLEMGSPALAVLRRAGESDDLEIRYRARRVVDAILDREHEGRLKAFLEATEPLPDDVLPGWPRYRDEVGDDRPARELFVEMQRAERRLFETVEKIGADGSGAAEASAAIAQRCIELQYRYSYGGSRRVPMGSLAAVIFLSGDTTVPVDATAKSRISSFCNYNDFRAQIASGDRVELAKSILGCWVGREDEKDVNQLYARVRLAMQYGVKRGLVPAYSLLKLSQVDTRGQYSLVALGRLGGEEELEFVEKLLTNKHVIYKSRVRNQPQYTCELRDIALGVAIHLRGGNLDQYGFAKLRKQVQYVFIPNTAGFENEEKRNAAFAKYEELRKGDGK